MVTITECDKFQENTIVVNSIREFAMNKATSYQRKEIEYEGIKVYLEFPEPANSEHDNKIKSEVKGILASALQEQMTKIS